MNDVPQRPVLGDALLWGLPLERIALDLAGGDGHEITGGNIFSPQSSSALVANVFGAFLERPALLPPLPGTEDLGWPAVDVRLERKLPFPWYGGRSPNLDVVIETATALIAVEAKRYEPFQKHGAPAWSNTYWKFDWGKDMQRFAAMRDRSRDRNTSNIHLVEAQLVKHAFGAWTAAQSFGAASGKTAVLYYLHAEPRRWPTKGGKVGALVPDSDLQRHAEEIARFGDAVRGDAVDFRSCTYRALLSSWSGSDNRHIRAHAAAVSAYFYQIPERLTQRGIPLVAWV